MYDTTRLRFAGIPDSYAVGKLRHRYGGREVGFDGSFTGGSHLCERKFHINVFQYTSTDTSEFPLLQFQAIMVDFRQSVAAYRPGCLNRECRDM